MSKDKTETQRIAIGRTPKSEVRQILTQVYDSLDAKGYKPFNQLVGYILSGDPTYITSHMNARGLITKIERDELLEEIIWFYMKDCEE